MTIFKEYDKCPRCKKGELIEKKILVCGNCGHEESNDE